MDLVSTALQLKTRLDTHWNLQLPSIVSSWFCHTVVIGVSLVLAFMLYSIYEQYESEVAKLLFNSIMLVFGFFLEQIYLLLCNYFLKNMEF
ncbi:hypothetical protein PRUPE_1G198000 [Prunus persica]|uniref:Uncharacterized protein n=1 Tax=Prunus persica TaxID=3760 RepID=A0A251R052_PRUPE|nr:hypothetical protein PRUPE_1G198000 [Prunus persica]